MPLPPPDIVRAAYAELVVTDLAEARRFYVDLLGLVVSAGDHEAEQVDPEPPGPLQVGDDQFGVGGPDDVGRHQAHAPNRGTWVAASGMWTIRDSV